MITSEMVYWITRLDYIRIALCVFGAISFVALLTTIEDYCVERFYWSIAFLAIFIFGVVLTPSTKEMCAILIIPKMANSETIKELGTDALEIKNLAISYLKEKMEVEKK